MSSLLDARDRLLEALEAGGLRTATTGKLAAPCVHVEPGDPWTQPARLPGRISRWRLTAVAGRADSETAFETLGALIDQTDAALRPFLEAQLPAWAKPSDYAIEGVPYAASVATIEVHQT